jgi:hypothetical protein
MNILQKYKQATIAPLYSRSNPLGKAEQCTYSYFNSIWLISTWGNKQKTNSVREQSQ